MERRRATRINPKGDDSFLVQFDMVFVNKTRFLRYCVSDMALHRRKEGYKV